MKGSDVPPLTLIPLLCQTYGWPEPVYEYRFCPTRKWRFDVAWPGKTKRARTGVSLEVEGGVWSNGRHVRGRGYVNDMEKYNHAQLLGWIVLRCTPQTAHQVAGLLKEALQT